MRKEMWEVGMTSDDRDLVKKKKWLRETGVGTEGAGKGKRFRLASLAVVCSPA